MEKRSPGVESRSVPRRRASLDLGRGPRRPTKRPRITAADATPHHAKEAPVAALEVHAVPRVIANPPQSARGLAQAPRDRGTTRAATDDPPPHVRTRGTTRRVLVATALEIVAEGSGDTAKTTATNTATQAFGTRAQTAAERARNAKDVAREVVVAPPTTRTSATTTGNAIE